MSNPYQGVNAHFNSWLQNHTGGWLTFHNNHIADLTRTLNATLPANYYAVSELSLQIQTPSDSSKGYPDVGIIQPQPSFVASQTSSVPSATMQIANAALPTVEDNLTAVEIYNLTDESKLVTRLELLSPRNKRDPQTYLAMRHKMISFGVNMIDIDYLHETPTIFRNLLATYPDEQAFPYCISISDNENTRFFCWHVDEPIPALPIPLADGERVVLAFGAAYTQTLAADRRAFMLIDYAQEPLRMGAYSLADQTRIKAVMDRYEPQAR